ncbi:hypothetical protein Lal_00012427, partial [Lupinus albus]
MQTRLPSIHNGLNIGVIVGIKSYEDLKSNITPFLSSETQLRDRRQINIQTNPHQTNQIPTHQTPMFPPMMNQPMTSQLPMYQPSMSTSYNLQPGRMSFHYEPSQHHHNR